MHTHPVALTSAFLVLIAMRPALAVTVEEEVSFATVGQALFGSKQSQAGATKTGGARTPIEMAVLRAAEERLGRRQSELEETVLDILKGRVSLDMEDPKLSRLFSEYLPYLDAIGFPKSDQDIRVSIVDEPTIPGAVAFFDPSEARVVVAKSVAGDLSIPLREYTHHVLLEEQPLRDDGHYVAIEAALADYFSSSFLDRPEVGEGIAALFGSKDPLRNLRNDLNHDDLWKRAQPETLHWGLWTSDVAEVWGGLLWALRAEVGRQAADSAVLSAWQELPRNARGRELVSAFAVALHRAALAKAPERQAQIDRLWATRKFPSGAWPVRLLYELR